MKIRTVVLGAYSTNTYALIDEKSGEAAVADCAVFNGECESFLRSLGIERLKYILLTHGHFDHICGVKQLRQGFGGEICIHSEDALCLEDSEKSFSSIAPEFEQSPVSADIILKDGDSLFLGDTKIRVMHTPGHTKGGVCYITDDSIISGDTLFRMSMGRTDFPGGSTRELFASLKALAELEGNFDVYPGHGEPTTLDFERKNNKYLRMRL